MTDQITDAPVAEPGAVKPVKRGVPLDLAIIVPIVVAGLVFGIWSEFSMIAQRPDSADKLSQVASITNFRQDTPTDIQKLFANPNVTDFRHDPVFFAPVWKAYEALSSDEVKKEQYDNLKRAIDLTGAITVSSAKEAAQHDVEFYQAYIDGGGFDSQLNDMETADAVRLTQQACAAGPGSTSAGFIAAWKLDTSNPKPSARLAPNADKAAADLTIQKAYVAAMTAGVKHLCP